jgi:hypothetical protein
VAKPRVSSVADKGGIKESTMLPWILAIISEDEVLANAFWTIAIMISPGARKVAYGTPAIICTDPRRESAKIANIRRVVTAGARMVWL